MTWHIHGQVVLTLERGHEAERDVVRGVVSVLRREVLADLAHDQVAARRLRQVASYSQRQRLSQRRRHHPIKIPWHCAPVKT